MRLTYQLQLSDFLELNGAAWEQRIKGWLTMLGGVGLGGFGIYLALFQNGQPDPRVIYPSAALVFALGLCATRIAGFGAWVRFRRRRFEIEVRPDGIDVLGGGGNGLIQWQDVSRWFETNNLFALVGGDDALAISKRSIPDGKLDELRELIRDGLGNPARW